MTATATPRDDRLDDRARRAGPDDLWRFDEVVRAGPSMVGYVVVGTDARIGPVLAVVHEPGHARLEVDVERWPASGCRTIPAGVIAAVDHRARMVMLNLCRHQIEAAPTARFDPDEDGAPVSLVEHFLPHLRGSS